MYMPFLIVCQFSLLLCGFLYLLSWKLGSVAIVCLIVCSYFYLYLLCISWDRVCIFWLCLTCSWCSSSVFWMAVSRSNILFMICFLLFVLGKRLCFNPLFNKSILLWLKCTLVLLWVCGWNFWLVVYVTCKFCISKW